MKKRTRNIILSLVIIQFVLIVGLLTLPTVVQAIPGRYRVAISERSPVLGDITEGVIDAVAPVATALPAPAENAAVNEADIAALISERSITAEPVETEEESAPEFITVESESTSLPDTEPVSESTLVPTSTATPEPTLTPTPIPARHVLEGMGVIKQTFNNCGPANLTQTLNYFGNDITQTEVASYLKPNPEDRNVSPWQIADYVNEQTPGFQAIARSGGTLQMIKQFVAAGYPVVIEKGYELPDSGWWGHYLTIFGYDDAKQEFYSQDSYLGPWDGSGRPASYDEIEQYWQQFNYTFYVVYEPHQEEEVAEILGPEMFDDFAMWQNAAALAEQEKNENPDDAIAWFNLGTALTRMGGLTGESRYYEGGAQAFDRARQIGLPPRMLWYQFQPYLAYMKLQRYQDIVDLANATLETQGGRNVEETFWYKGHALAFLGDVVGAREAYQEALNVNENFYPAQWSLDALN
ncbi:MAG: C39 family peptidase [Candidatus Promineifilaceae bacterium]|nr:C39 family peptidase [Candidatus Promineifilaceae bacterium]